MEKRLSSPHQEQIGCSTRNRSEQFGCTVARRDVSELERRDEMTNCVVDLSALVRRFTEGFQCAHALDLRSRAILGNAFERFEIERRSTSRGRSWQRGNRVR